MYTIALNAECLSIISGIEAAVHQYGQNNGENAASVLNILNQFETQSNESPVQAGLFIDQKLQACDALQKQLETVQNDQHELISESMNKLRLCLQNQKRDLMPSLLLEKIIGCYAGSIAPDGSVTELESRKQKMQKMQEIISLSKKKKTFLGLVKDSCLTAEKYETFQESIASAYQSVYGEDGDAFGEVDDLTSCPDLLVEKNKFMNFFDDRIFSHHKIHIVTQLMRAIEQQAGLSARFQKNIEDIERVGHLATRNRACELTFGVMTSRSPVCDSHQTLESLCQEIKSINACVSDYAAIAADIPDDIPEAKVEIGLKECYIEAVAYLKGQLVSASDARVDKLNRYIDSQLTENDLLESIRKYGMALKIAITSLAEDDPNRKALQKKDATLNNLLAQGSFISMCGGIDSLAQHGYAMVSRFFTTGTVDAQDVCRTLSQDLKVAVIKCLKDEITEFELVQAIDSTATPFITDMKNRNVFSKVAKFFAGIIEFIGRCAGYQPDFFKPKRKALAEAVVTQAKSLNNSQSVH